MGRDEAKAELACPMLALAARDDAIVPAAMSEAIWGSDRHPSGPETAAMCYP